MVVVAIIGGVIISISKHKKNNIIKKQIVSEMAQNTKDTIVNPHLYSNTRDGEQFEITASKAENTADTVVLHDVVTTLHNTDGKSIIVEAKKATFDINTKTLNMDGNAMVSILDHTEEKLYMNSANIAVYTKEQKIIMKETVHVKTSDFYMVSSGAMIDVEQLDITLDKVILTHRQDYR